MTASSRIDFSDEITGKHVCTSLLFTQMIHRCDTDPEVAGVCKSIGWDLWFTARRVQCHQYRGLRPRGGHWNIPMSTPLLHWQWYTALHVQLSKYYFSCLLLLILSFLCASSRLFCPHVSAQPLSRMSLGGNNCSGSTLGMSTFGAPLSVGGRADEGWE